MLIDLVKYEGLFERFLLTEQRLYTELFGPTADWNCLVATIDNKLVGFCFYSFANTDRAFNPTPALHIDEIYVSSEHRQAKIGQHLIHHVAQIAKAKNIERIKLYCVKDNDIGQKFYQKIGGKKLEFLDIYKIYLDDLTLDLT
jgi:ribosomal protein S18 acetylase RimI-like enzyme